MFRSAQKPSNPPAMGGPGSFVYFAGIQAQSYAGQPAPTRKPVYAVS